MENQYYPYIPNEVLEYLKQAYPSTLPMYELKAFDLGKLVGQQEVIQHLSEVKKWSEEKEEI